MPLTAQRPEKPHWSTQSFARIRAWIWRYDRAPLSIAMIENRMTPTWP
ncbi:MAG: hypothetical protein ACXW3J_02295 [Methylocystis sp.]